jgi:hypothetical protein
LIYNTAMRRFFIVLFILIMLIACRTLIPTAAPTPTVTIASSTASPTQTILPSTETATQTPSPTPQEETSTPSPAATQTDTSVPVTVNFDVRTHPDGDLYVGDLVSLEVIVPPGISLDDSEVTIQVDPPQGTVLGPSQFSPFGIEGRKQATLIWAWDTAMIEAGEHELHFSIQPQEITFTETVTLLPASELPADEAGAAWASMESECCTTWYLTHSAAERDLLTLLDQADTVAQNAMDQMGIEFSEPITITILPRLLGHGGFASDEVHVSYLDRNYSTNTWAMVLHHEMIHILDRRLGGELRPSILVEGLAVYQSGGHYKKEDLIPRTAALLENHLNWYIPLKELSHDFYASQHEIGYLEAGALVAYMVERWGWEAYSNFYRDIHPQDEGGEIAAIDAALTTHFELSFSELEGDFITALQAEPEAASWVEDVRLTVLYYDTLRRYQQMMDPSAYFRTAWLLDTEEMRRRDIVADYYRHPSQADNIALETLMIAASEDISAARYLGAEAKLEAVNAVLDAIAENDPQPFSVNWTAKNYLETVRALTDSGYQAQQINLNEGVSQALVTTTTGGELIEVVLIQAEGY